MKISPLLEELWQVKDDLAREAGYEIPSGQIIHEPDDAEAANRSAAED